MTSVPRAKEAKRVMLWKDRVRTEYKIKFDDR